jgi:hypothetical protein
MLMGSTGAADLILPLSMVASLRHQRIINMNKRLKQKNRWLHDKILQHHGTQIFLGCLWNLWAMNSRTQIMKCMKLLLGEGEHRGLDLSPRCLLLPSSLVSTWSTRFHCPNVHNHSFVCVIKGSTSIVSLLVPSCSSLASLLPPISYKNKALASPHACPLHVPKMPNDGYVMHRGALYANHAQKPPLIMFRC